MLTPILYDCAAGIIRVSRCLETSCAEYRDSSDVERFLQLCESESKIATLNCTADDEQLEVRDVR